MFLLVHVSLPLRTKLTRAGKVHSFLYWWPCLDLGVRLAGLCPWRAMPSLCALVTQYVAKCCLYYETISIQLAFIWVSGYLNGCFFPSRVKPCISHGCSCALRQSLVFQRKPLPPADTNPGPEPGRQTNAGRDMIALVIFAECSEVLGPPLVSQERAYV